MKTRTGRIALLAVIVHGLSGGTTFAATITTGLAPSDFVSPVIEKFVGPSVTVSSHDFGNGMTYANLAASADLINYTGSYGMGTEPSISGDGKDGPGDGYFGTSQTPTTFELAFPSGTSAFGFFGAESSVSGGSSGRNAELDLEFYDLSNALIGAVTFSTAGVFAFDQFHGFSSDVPIGRVVFRDVGHMVLDDVYFGQSSPPALCHGVAATIVGTNGDDVIDGTDGDDVIAGLGGNDTIRGGHGNDIICGDAGHDVLSGGPGDDLILGGPGADQIAGNAGNDVLAGGDGNDTLHGGKGHDNLDGGHGDDVLDGGADKDQCNGGPGHNRLKSCP